MKTYHPASQSNIVPFSSQALNAGVPSQVNRSIKTWKSFSQKRFSQFIQALATIMLPPSEPKIYQKRDRQGNVYYHVYDPVTGMSSTFGSEQEIRIWLDRRYHA